MRLRPHAALQRPHRRSPRHAAHRVYARRAEVQDTPEGKHVGRRARTNAPAGVRGVQRELHRDRGAMKLPLNDHAEGAAAERLRGRHKQILVLEQPALAGSGLGDRAEPGRSARRVQLAEELRGGPGDDGAGVRPRPGCRPRGVRRARVVPASCGGAPLRRFRQSSHLELGLHTPHALLQDQAERRARAQLFHALAMRREQGEARKCGPVRDIEALKAAGGQAEHGIKYHPEH
mmetsp:Transcript_24147/g.69861  ORF Transcript_24147/g.69861 Transcript_24147/m.69861 type:complete len:233 (+) Transcript_24147:293-991(+)